MLLIIKEYSDTDFSEAPAGRATKVTPVPLSTFRADLAALCTLCTN